MLGLSIGNKYIYPTFYRLYIYIGQPSKPFVLPIFFLDVIINLTSYLRLIVFIIFNKVAPFTLVWGECHFLISSALFILLSCIKKIKFLHPNSLARRISRFKRSCSVKLHKLCDSSSKPSFLSIMVLKRLRMELRLNLLQ